MLLATTSWPEACLWYQSHIASAPSSILRTAMTWLTPNDEQPMPLSTAFTKLLRDIHVKQLRNGKIQSSIKHWPRSSRNPRKRRSILRLFHTYHEPHIGLATFTRSSRNRPRPLRFSNPTPCLMHFQELIREPASRPNRNGKMHALTFPGELAVQLKNGGAYKSLSSVHKNWNMPNGSASVCSRSLR